MTDLISRADAMAEFREWVKRANENGETPTWNDAVSLIGSLPSAETHEIRTETHGVCLISKDDAMGAVQDHFNADGFKGYDDGQKMMDRIKALPSADAVQGEWEDREVFNETDDDHIVEEWQSARCSVCGKYHTTPYMYYFDDFNYCPNCGARMKGGAE